MSDIIERVIDGLQPPLEIRSHPACLLHRPGPGHPESPARLQVVLDALSARVDGRWSMNRESPIPDDDDILGALAWVHDRAYIDRVREARPEGALWIDSEDCLVSDGTFEAASAAAGLALQVALDLANNRTWRAFVVARPPGHHAHRDRAAGYCFFNSVALAAEVVTRCWAAPVVIADFGAFHGAGTQEIFFSRGDVGYVSVHQYPAFPGTGGADEIGSEKGLGATRNIPLAAGSDDEVVSAAFESALWEVCGRLRPRALLLAAGFDGHRDDPVGGLGLTENGFARLTATAVRAAETWCEGRIVSFLEGGYDLHALANCVRVHAEGLANSAADSATWT